MAFAIGHITGCHLNPAVSIGLSVGKRFPGKDLPEYIIAQVLGALAAAGLISVIAGGLDGFAIADCALASNGFGDRSPNGYNVMSGLMAEGVLTFMFLFIILGATDKRAPAGFAPIAIGLGLTLIHLIGIPITNVSVNPARSTGPAIFEGAAALGQLWMFWVAPIVGAILAGIVYPAVTGRGD